MSETFFISDSHFSHRNILKYQPVERPFLTIEEHDEELIRRWNSVVGTYDKVYHLGDFCFGRKNIIIAERLNGKKRLILGNHDIYPVEEYAKYFNRIYGAVFYKRCILTHIPVHTHDLTSRWFLNIHGHLHSNKVRIELDYMVHQEEDRHYFNVCVEQCHGYPIPYDFIEERLKEIDS